MIDYSQIFQFWSSKVNGFLLNAKTYNNAYKFLLTKQRGERYTYPAAFLASTSAELFLKSLIAINYCNEHTNDTSLTQPEMEKTLKNIFRSNGHKINILLDNNLELRKYLNINDIVYIQNGKLWEFNFILTGGRVVNIKHPEACRYGIFSHNPDYGIFSDFETLSNFLNKLEKFADIKNEELLKKLKLQLTQQGTISSTVDKDAI